MRIKTLIIDNHDSFTHLLAQRVGEAGGNPEVVLNDAVTVAELKKKHFTHLILSPGPGTVDNPKDRGIMLEAIEAFWKKVPILGVCLGHQGLGKFFGGTIISAPTPVHGKRALVYHDGTGVFKGVPNPCTVMRYHSLVVDPSFFLKRADVDVTATTDDFLIMGLAHRKYPVFGVQFHPESIGTPDGMQVIRNFLKTHAA